MGVPPPLKIMVECEWTGLQWFARAACGSACETGWSTVTQEAAVRVATEALYRRLFGGAAEGPEEE